MGELGRAAYGALRDFLAGLIVGGIAIAGVVSFLRPSVDTKPAPSPVIGPLASAEPYTPTRYTLPHVWETLPPPVKYRGDARAVVEFVRPDSVHARCAGAIAAAGTYGEFLSCAKMYPGEATLVMPNPCAFSWEPYAALLCHELAHANGWKHERENAL